MRKFEHLDRIVVKRKEFERLLRWVEGESKQKEKFLSVGISLRKGVIEYEVGKDQNPVDLGREATIFHYFEERDATIHSEVFARSGSIFTSICTYEANDQGVTRIIRMMNRSYVTLNTQEKEAIRAYAGHYHHIFALIFGYIEHMQEHAEIVQKQIVAGSSQAKKKKNGKKQRRQKKITNKKTIYTIVVPDDIKELVRGRGGFQRHVESWTVRGHWRKYKNGKRVWIRPYTKGEGKTEGKTYVVETN